MYLQSYLYSTECLKGTIEIKCYHSFLQHEGQSNCTARCLKPEGRRETQWQQDHVTNVWLRKSTIFTGFSFTGHMNDTPENSVKIWENKSKRWQTPLAAAHRRLYCISWLSGYRGVVSQYWLMQRTRPVRLAKEENQTPLSGYSQISDLAHSHTVFVYIMISYWLEYSYNSDALHTLINAKCMSLFKYFTLNTWKWTPFMFLVFV